MNKPDVIYETQNEDVIFRLRPNQEAPPGTGYTWGAELLFRSKDGQSEWSDPMFISPDCLGALAAAFQEAAKDAQGSKA